jgi:hypothetical protein
MHEQLTDTPDGLSPRSVGLILFGLVLVGVIARLYHIEVPLFDWHVYRQHDTAAMARNFFDGPMNILYPTVDWRGASPGFVEVEFQIYTFPVAILYHVFGPHEWVGRAFNILVYVFSAILLFHFTRRLFDDRAALFATFVYTFVPLSFFQTRAFQPDALLALGSLAALYFFWRWTEDERIGHLLLSGVGLCIAALIKPPSLYLGVPLLYLAGRRFGLGMFRQRALWIFAIVVLVPPILWFSHAYRLWEVYGNTFGLLGRKTVAGIWAIGDPRWGELASMLVRRLVHEIATPPGLLLLAVGALARVRGRNLVLLWWAIGFALFVLLVPRGNWGHDHYQLPLVFITAAYMGFGATLLLDRGIFTKSVLALLLVALLGFSARQLRPMLRDAGHPRIEFGKRVEALTEPEALVVFVARRPEWSPPSTYRHRTAEGEFLYADPIDFYYSRRKGWSIDDFQATPSFVNELRSRGAKYLASAFKPTLERHPDLMEALNRDHTLLESTERWAIYRLEAPGPDAADAGEGAEDEGGGVTDSGR